MGLEVLYEVDGPVVVIRLNRPEVRNCIDPATHRALVAAWTRFRDDAEALVAVLTGSGEQAFCTGADMRAIADLLPVTADDVEANDRGERAGYLGPSRWTDLYKPVIAAVNGAAYAGGLEWALWADIRIAEEHASFGVTCRRWNIGLADGGTARLPLVVGLGRALDLIVTGRVVDAAEALRMGLVNEVVPRGASLARARALAHAIARLPQEALRSDKEATLRGVGRPLDEALRIEVQCFNRLLGSPELQEGIRRFVERDHPDRRPGEPSVTPGLVRE